MLPVSPKKGPKLSHSRPSHQTSQSITSTALTIAARQASRTPVHHNHRLGAALAAHGGVGRVVAGFVVVRGRGVAGFELGAFFGEDALGDFAHFLAFNQADGLEVLLDHGADFGDK